MASKRPLGLKANKLLGRDEIKGSSLAKDNDGTGLGKKKKPAEVYHYGRGGRQTTTDKSVADRGKINSGVIYAPRGKTGSIKEANRLRNMSEEEREANRKKEEERWYKILRGE